MLPPPAPMLLALAGKEAENHKYRPPVVGDAGFDAPHTFSGACASGHPWGINSRRSAHQLEEAIMISFHHQTFGSAVAGISVVFGCLCASSALAQDKEALIQNALSAAPPDVAETATVMDNAGNVLREGSGEYTCFPYEGGSTVAMCADAEWLAWADAYMAKNEDYTPSGFGLAYMLAGDPPEGGASNIDPFATEPSADNQWITEGPHVMILVPDPAMLEDMSTDPYPGEPYVMWKGTPYAHIMMPTGPRPKQ